MKKSWMLVLFISLGLNLGLGYRVWLDRSPASGTLDTGQGAHHTRVWRADAPDSLWRRNLAERRLKRMAAELGLRPPQVAALRDIQQANEANIHRLGRELEALRTVMRALLAGSSVDSLQVRAVLHDMGRRQAELDSQVTETVMREMKVLDQGQKADYLDMLPMGRRHFRGSGRGSQGARR